GRAGRDRRDAAAGRRRGRPLTLRPGSERDMTTTTQVDAAAMPASTTPIGDYGLIADCNSAALVDRSGAVEWLCLPSYDSPAVFARILDPEAGHWSIRPMAEFTSERRYRPGTLVLETTFRTATGAVRVVDAMAVPMGQRGRDLGLGVPHELLRLV